MRAWPCTRRTSPDRSPRASSARARPCRAALPDASCTHSSRPRASSVARNEEHGMTDVLARILATKREEVALGRRERAFGDVDRAARARGEVRDFGGAIATRVRAGAPAVIAEVKKA